MTRTGDRFLHVAAIVTLPIWIVPFLACLTWALSQPEERGPVQYLGDGHWGPEW